LLKEFSVQYFSYHRDDGVSKKNSYGHITLPFWILQPVSQIDTAMSTNQPIKIQKRQNKNGNPVSEVQWNFEYSPVEIHCLDHSKTEGKFPSFHRSRFIFQGEELSREEAFLVSQSFGVLDGVSQCVIVIMVLYNPLSKFG